MEGEQSVLTKVIHSEQELGVIRIDDKLAKLESATDECDRREQSTATKSTTTSTTTSIIAEKLTVGRDCNAILIGDPDTKQAVLIDPGGDPATILRWVKKFDVKVSQILVTHAHFDHILAADKVRHALRCPIWLHRADLQLWRQLPQQLRLLGLKRRGAACTPRRPLPDPDHFLQDGDKLEILNGVTIHTPGHTQGSVCFYFPDHNLLVSGDTLFKHYIGRTDLPGGDPHAIRRSVVNKLYTLPPETRVLPGHGAETTIEIERSSNKIVRVCVCKKKEQKARSSSFSQSYLSTSSTPPASPRSKITVAPPNLSVPALPPLSSKLQVDSGLIKSQVIEGESEEAEGAKVCESLTPDPFSPKTESVASDDSCCRSGDHSHSSHGSGQTHDSEHLESIVEKDHEDGHGDHEECECTCGAKKETVKKCAHADKAQCNFL